MNPKAKTLLKRAKALILKHGWVQTNYGDTKKGFCAVGALRHANNQAFMGGDAARTALEALQSVTDVHVITWNDAKGRRKSQVLKAYDKAIASL